MALSPTAIVPVVLSVVSVLTGSAVCADRMQVRLPIAIPAFLLPEMMGSVVCADRIKVPSAVAMRPGRLVGINFSAA